MRSAPHKLAFADERVQFVQADLTRDAHVDRAFNPEFGPYDYVFNLAGETKCGLSGDRLRLQVPRPVGEMRCVERSCVGD